MRMLFAFFLVTTFPVGLWAADLTGQWTLGLRPDFSGHDDDLACSFRQEDDKLTVNCGSGPNILGELKGRTVTLVMKTGRQNEFTATFVGSLDGGETTISGTWQLTDSQGEHEGKFTATKRPA